MYVELITVGSFVLISLLVFGFTFWLFGKRRKPLPAGKGIEEIEGPEPSWLSRSMASALPLFPNEADGILEDLRYAGHYRKSALVEYLATRNTLLVGVMIITGTLAVLADPKSVMPTIFIAIGVVITFFGHMFPRLMLRQQAKSRLDRIDKGLPDALDITSMSLTGGLPLRDALQRCSNEIRFAWPDIALEFEIIRRQAEAMSMSKALRKFADRIDTPDVKAFASLITQTERMGVQVSTAVAEFAEGLRVARRQRAEERANKASVKLMFPIIFCLAPPIWLLLMGPPLLRVHQFFTQETQEGGILDRNLGDTPQEAFEAMREQQERLEDF